MNALGRKRLPNARCRCCLDGCRERETAAKLRLARSWLLAALAALEHVILRKLQLRSCLKGKMCRRPAATRGGTTSLDENPTIDSG
jgi:hypothetical protein